MLKLEVIGEGTRKNLAMALRVLANNLHSEDCIEEIYNIDGAGYYDNTIQVTLVDSNID